MARNNNNIDTARISCYLNTGLFFILAWAKIQNRNMLIVRRKLEKEYYAVSQNKSNYKTFESNRILIFDLVIHNRVISLNIVGRALAASQYVIREAYDSRINTIWVKSYKNKFIYLLYL